MVPWDGGAAHHADRQRPVEASHAAMIRAFTSAEAAAFREIRLEALRLHPDSFGADFEEESPRDAAAFAAGMPKDPPDAVFGAWLPGEAAPQGMAGLYAERRRKLAHKGHVWGVYVRKPARGHGLATCCWSR